MLLYTQQLTLNTVVLIYADGRRVCIRTDDGSAAELAAWILDWSDVFRRQDEAKEVTQIIEVA
jgi:hypothetical protein